MIFAPTLRMTVRFKVLTILFVISAIMPSLARAQDATEILIEDGFSNNMIRPENGKLDKTAVEHGHAIWTAQAGLGFGKNRVTNTSRSGTHVATVPVVLEDHLEYAEFQIEANINPIGAEFVGLGFTKSERGPFWSHGEIWARLHDTGIIEILADGENIELYQSSAPEPSFVQGQNSVKLKYHHGLNTVRCWLNGVELSLPHPDLNEFDFHPRFTQGGFHAHAKANGWSREGDLEIDAFKVIIGDLLIYTDVPQDWTAVEGTEAFFFGAVTGGLPPYTYQWQYRVNPKNPWLNLIDNNNISGATTDTLWISSISTANHAGYYRLAVTSAAAGGISVVPPSAELKVVAAEVADFFTNTPGVPERAISEGLNGAVAEVSRVIPPPDWIATDGPAFGNNVLTNHGNTDKEQVGGLPFVFNESIAPGSDYRYATVEAMVNIVDPYASWISVGFTNSATVDHRFSGQLRAFLRGDGRFFVMANGSNSLYSDTEANPAATTGWNYIKIQYDRLFNSARVWLNQTEIVIQDPSLDRFNANGDWAPSISHAGFQSHCANGHAGKNGFFLENFAAGYDGEITALLIADQPDDLSVQRSFTGQLSVTPSGGIEPYSYQWQFRRKMWVNAAELSNVSGEDTNTLTVNAAEVEHQAEYRVIITDSHPNPSEIISESAYLTVANSTTGCAIADQPITDFVADFDEWTAEGMDRWVVVQTQNGPQVEFRSSSYNPQNDDYGRIRKNETVAPKGYNTVRIQFKSLDQATNMRLAWGPEPDQAYHFHVEPGIDFVDLDLSILPSWADAPEIAGFCTRDLLLHFDTRRASGVIERIDVWSGPYLVFDEYKPVLYLGENPAETFGAGARMKVHQKVRNEGCDMGRTEAVEERWITYTLCQEDNLSNCYQGFEDCNGGQIYIGGDLKNNETYTDEWCFVDLPPAKEENLTTWRLTSRFDNDLTKDPASTTFRLIEYGTPNLSIASYPPIEAMATFNGVYQTRPWLDVTTSFSVKATVESRFYPTPSAVCEVWGRAHDPVTLGGEWDWRLLGSTSISDIGLCTEVTIENLNVMDVMPQGKTWALMDLKLVIDPGNSIDEGEGEGDNELQTNNWIMVASQPFSNAVGRLIFADEMDQTIAAPITNDLEYSFYEHRLSIRPTAPVDPEEMPQPYLYWQGLGASANAGISGIMIRFRRDRWVFPSEIHMGTAPDGTVGLDPYTKMMIDTKTYHPNTNPDLEDDPVQPLQSDQWQTAVWKMDGLEPFDAYADPDIILKRFIKLGVASSSAESLYFAVDASSLNFNDQYTGTVIDYVGAWESLPAEDTEDAWPWGMVENNETAAPESLTEWAELPEYTLIGTAHALGARVFVTDGISIGDVSVLVNRKYHPTLDGPQVGPTVELTTDPGYEPLGDGTYVFTVSEGGSGNPWITTEGGYYYFEIIIDVTNPEDYSENNVRTGRVRVSNHCPVPPLMLPY